MKRGRVSRIVAAIAALVAVPAVFAAPGSVSSAVLVTVKSPVVRGEQGHLVADVGTAPRCGIAVFKRHPYVRMRPKRIDRWGLGLYPKHPDAADGGRIAWTWAVDARTSLAVGRRT